MTNPDARPRARDLGVPFDGTPGPLNAITDIPGLEVGHATIITDGTGGGQKARTGVTAILPRGPKHDPVFAGWHSLNGNGEMTGTTWIEESGFLAGPVLLTNTHSVGLVRDAAIAWLLERGLHEASATGLRWFLPVVAETYDGWLNEIDAFHVRPEHVFAALDAAASGPAAEGNVGGGTGTICYRFKGGIGTSSRRIAEEGGSWIVGVLVQANFGRRRDLVIAGVPVGRQIPDLLPEGMPRSAGGAGSVIAVVATDAPLLPHQLKRLARRVPLGLARTGSFSANGSGDIFLAFSTANAGAALGGDIKSLQMLPNARMDPLFEATVQATEEAVVNALVAAETMTGRNGLRVHALPHDRLRSLMSRRR